MQFKDQVDFVRQHIKKNKLRVFMTVLAATMGTAFLIVLASVGFGIHDTVRNEVLSNRLVTEIQVHSSGDGDDLAKHIEELKKIDHVKAVVNRQYLSSAERIKMGEFEGGRGLIVTDFMEEGKVGFELAEGRLPEKANEVVVGSHFKEYLSKVDADSEEVSVYDGNVIGEKFTYQFENIDGEFADEKVTFTIVGVGKNPAREWVHDGRVYVHKSIVPELERIHFSGVEGDEDGYRESNPLFYSDVNVYVDQLENLKSVSKALKDDGYSVYSISDELDQLDVFFLALKAGLIFVGTIAILISSIGIFNTMTMAVTERTREIGVMKAIGANPKLIQRLFLMESVWIGIVGTVLAVVISYGVSMVSNYVLPMIVSSALGQEDLGGMNVTFSIIPWQLVVIASVISISVAMISGWRPARKATKIDVINALRQEL